MSPEFSLHPQAVIGGTTVLAPNYAINREKASDDYRVGERDVCTSGERDKVRRCKENMTRMGALSESLANNFVLLRWRQDGKKILAEADAVNAVNKQSLCSRSHVSPV